VPTTARSRAASAHLDRLGARRAQRRGLGGDQAGIAGADEEPVGRARVVDQQQLLHLAAPEPDDHVVEAVGVRLVAVAVDRRLPVLRGDLGDGPLGRLVRPALERAAAAAGGIPNVRDLLATQRNHRHSVR